jgi:tetratricopeptide (TPR) repeat protein
MIATAMAIYQNFNYRALGKTQLAVEYAYSFKDAYPNGVIWINSDQDIEVQLIELVDAAGWITPESEHKDKLAVAKQRLRAYPDCLVVFDNVESLDAIKDYLQLLHHTTHILATTRFELSGFEPIPIDPLDEDLSYQLLIQESRRELVDESEKKIAFEIVKKLGGHPLAIELAGAYLRQRPTVGLEQYQRLLASNLKDALPKKFLQNAFTKHKADLYSTLKINESLFDDEPRLKDILDLLAWSGSAPMGEDLLCRLLNIEDSTKLIGALGLGTTLRILHKPQNTESYSIHRLVREVRREDIPLQGKESWITTICIAISEWFKEKRNDYSDLRKYEAEIEHLKSWEQNAMQCVPQYASRLIWLQAYPSFHQGRYSETLSLLNKASKLYENLNLQDLDLKAHLLNDSGAIISILGDLYTALTKQKESLRIRQELYGEKNEDVAYSLSNVGSAFGNLGKYEEELEYAQKALALRKELLGEKHPDVATSLNNVGGAFGNLGNYQEDANYRKAALNLCIDLLGKFHPNTLRVILGLANTYLKIDNRDAAFHLVNPLLNQLPQSNSFYPAAKRLNQVILSKTVRPGFRQPPTNTNKRKKKGKKK